MWERDYSLMNGIQGSISTFANLAPIQTRPFSKSPLAISNMLFFGKTISSKDLNTPPAIKFKSSFEMRGSPEMKIRSKN